MAPGPEDTPGADLRAPGTLGDTAVETLWARRLLHPALASPTIVLIPESERVDTTRTLARMGFRPDGNEVEVAERAAPVQSFQDRVEIAEGPGTDVVRDVADQLALASRGRLSDAIVEPLAAELAELAPQWQSAFWDAVFDVALTRDDRKLAQRAFEAALDTEGLAAEPMDTAARLARAIGAAVAGLVKAQVWGRYAAELTERLGAKEAWALFRALCVGQTRGGAPPWSGMARLAHKMIRASGLPREAEARRFTADILDAPAVRRAPPSFWRESQRALLSLVADRPRARRLILDIVPEVPPTKGFWGFWAKLIEDGGALIAADPDWDAALWFEKLLRAIWGTPDAHTIMPRLIDLAAPRLMEGAPLVCRDREGRLIADVLDRALELGLPIADPDPRDTLDALRWDDAPEPARPLTFLGADPRFEALLDAALLRLLGDVHAPLPARSGLAATIDRWVDAQLQHIESGALPRAIRAIERLRQKAPFGAVPSDRETVVRLGELSMGPALLRTLRAGIIDELGWPDLDAGLEGRDPEPLRFGGAFPHLVVWDGSEARAVGPGGWLGKATLSLPTRSEPVIMRWVEGQFQIVTREPFVGCRCLWTAEEGDPEPTERVGESLRLEEAHPIEGGITLGGAPVRPGWPVLGREAGVRVLCDGEGWWVRVGRGARAVFQRFDPETGERGEKGAPSFLEGLESAGWKLMSESVELRQAPDALNGSLLGTRGGLLGWRVRSGPEGVLECEGIDGRRWRGALEDRAEPEGRRPREVPWALIDWPGSAHRRMLSTAGDVLKLWDLESGEVLARVEGSRGAYAAGSALVMSPLWWHLLAPRDIEGSKALRRAQPGDATALIKAHQDGESACKARIEDLMPGLSDPWLLRGVLGLVSLAAGAEASLKWLLEKWGEDSPAPAKTAVERFFREGSQTPVSFEKGQIPWDMVGHAGAWAFRAAALGTSEEDRTKALSVLESWTASILSGDGVAVRAFDAVFENRSPTIAGSEAPLGDWGVEIEGHRYGLRLWQEWEPRRIRCRGLELSREGRFVDLPGAQILSEHRTDQMPWSGRRRLRALLEGIKAEGPLPWSPAIGVEIARRTGLSEASAAYLWAGCPGLKVYRKDFLGKALRDELGLSVAEAAQARKTIGESSTAALRARVWSEAMPEDPAALWTPLGTGAGDPDTVVARLCRAWNRAVGRGPDVSESLLEDANRSLRKIGLPAETMLAAVAAPDTSEIFQTDAVWHPTEEGRLRPDLDPASRGFFTGAAVVSVAHYLPFLHTALPVGDPLQEGLSQLIALTWRRLSNPELLFGAGNRSFTSPDALGKAQDFLRSWKGAPLEGLEGVDTGPWLAVLTESVGPMGWSMVSFACRPARIVDFEGLSTLARDPFGAWRGVLEACRLLRSGGFAAMVDRLRSSPLQPGQWEANPLHSARHTVTAIQRRHDLSEDAAALYLQHLTLPNPEAAQLQRWNGWDEARLTAIQDRLLARSLLERGEDGVHLPGPRVALKEAERPVSMFKLSLYGIEPEGSGWSAPLRRVLPIKPMHALFAEAWRRQRRGF